MGNLQRHWRDGTEQQECKVEAEPRVSETTKGCTARRTITLLFPDTDFCCSWSQGFLWGLILLPSGIHQHRRNCSQEICTRPRLGMCCQRLSPTAGDDGAQCTPHTPGRALLALRASARAVISCRECAPSAPQQRGFPWGSLSGLGQQTWKGRAETAENNQSGYMSVGRSVRRVTERKELEVMKLSKRGSRSQVVTALKEGKSF